MVVAIDEAIGSGLEIQLTEGNNRLSGDIARDIEAKIQAAAQTGGGGQKQGNLSYLNAQVRFVDGRFQIESGTVSTSFTGSGRSAVKVGPPGLGTDVRATLGFDITTDSETLATRGIIETALTSAYTSGDTLTVGSTAGLAAGDAFVLTDGTNDNIATISGLESASVLRFTAVSGAGEGIANVYSTGALLKKLHQVDIADPVSAIVTVDQLYRFSIDTMVNQIDFSS
jgi:hypothetical protein